MRLHDDQYYLQFDGPNKRLLDPVRVVAAYDCLEHDRSQLCSCPRALGSLTDNDRRLFAKIHVALEWEQHLLRNDAAFRYTDATNHQIFTHLKGMSPRQFTARFAEETFAEPSMTAPAKGLDKTVSALLAY